MTWTHAVEYEERVNISEGPNGFWGDLRTGICFGLSQLQSRMEKDKVEPAPETLVITLAQNATVHPRWTVSVSMDGLEES